MTQRIFDVENEKDMADLWNIFPDEVCKIEAGCGDVVLVYSNAFRFSIDDIFSINFHDKTEITRPMPESTEADIGKICRFWNDKEHSDDVCFGVLYDIREDESCGKVYLRNKEMWYGHARRLTKQEIEELI